MRTLIRDVQVFDGERTRLRTDVLIENDRITEHDDRAVDSVIDGRGRTLLPGLIDAHVHTFDGNLAQALTFGVTTVLDMFCLPPNLLRQRQLAARRDDVADLRSCGVLATAPGGHPSQIMSAEMMGHLGDAVGPFDTIAGPGQVDAFVQARVAEGVDYLKIVVDAGSGLPTLDARTVAMLVDAGHDAGLLTIAHITTAADADIALAAGIDGLAHAWDGAGQDPAGLAATAAEGNVFVISALAELQVRTGAVAGALPVVRALHHAGVQLMAGTDANPFAPPHGESMHQELLLLVEAGLTAEEALTAATSAPADRFGLVDRGRVAPGLRADLLLVQGDPTRDISATRAIVDVWRRGVHQPR